MDSPKDSTDDKFVIPVVEEHARVDVRPVVHDRVIIRTVPETREEVVERVLRDEELLVERVPVGAEVAEAPAVREEAGVLIVPVVEEELVVRTRLVLKEELRIRRREVSRTVRVPVRLRREVVNVERAPCGHSGEHSEDGGQKTDGTHN